MKHWSNKKKPKMLLNKLQLIATAPQFKVKWLEHWNSSVHSYQEVHFLPKRFTKKDLKAWLNIASFLGRDKQSRSIVIIDFNLLSTMIAHDFIHLQSEFDALFIHLISCPYMLVMKLPLISYSTNIEHFYHVAFFFSTAA